MADIRIVDSDQNKSPVTAASIKRLPSGEGALKTFLVDTSGDFVNAGGSSANPTSATYGRKNVTTAATLIMDTRVGRVSGYVQNLETQHVFVGFSSGVTAAQPGAVLAPTSLSSGDGGNLSVNRYDGPLYGIVASGDADICFSDV